MGFAPRIDETLTLEQWKALDLTRPLTDPPIGGMTDARRSHDANCSALFDEVGIARPGWRKPKARNTHDHPEPLEKYL